MTNPTPSTQPTPASVAPGTAASPYLPALQALAARDPAIAAALSQVGPPPPRSKPLTFDNLCRVIIGQQLSVRAASTIVGRMHALPGGVQTPAALRAQPIEALRSVGLSGQKARYVHALAEAVDAGSLDLAALPALDDEAAIAQLTAIKGLGRWSAEMVLLFMLDRPDVWPVGDLGVRIGVGRLLGLAERPDVATVQAAGERWRPHRSAVAMFCWHLNANAPV